MKIIFKKRSSERRPFLLSRFSRGALFIFLMAISGRLVFAVDVTERKTNWWMELWGDIGYQRTDFWYEAQKNFGISVLAPKAGYRFHLSENMYLDPYLKADVMYDVLQQDQNRFFWNNSVKFGPGMRIRWEFKRPYKPGEAYGFRFNYANLDGFAEYLGIIFFDRGQVIPDTVPRNDFRAGWNSWISADTNIKLTASDIMGGIWFEMWNDLSYHSTNFFTKGNNGFLILTTSPKAGLRLAYSGVALEPYFRLDFVRDFLNQDWNHEAWSNNVKYGPGIRLSVGGVTRRNETSVYIYFESLHADYSARAGWKAAGLSTYDYRAGVNFWIPIGATKGK